VTVHHVDTHSIFEFDHALVTGGTGFIGGHLADRLVDDCAVTVYDDLSTGSRDHIPEDALFIHAEIRDADTLRDAVTDADIVFHEAAQVSVQRSVDDLETSHGVNIDPPSRSSGLPGTRTRAS